MSEDKDEDLFTDEERNIMADWSDWLGLALLVVYQVLIYTTELDHSIAIIGVAGLFCLAIASHRHTWLEVFFYASSLILGLRSFLSVF